MAWSTRGLPGQCVQFTTKHTLRRGSFSKLVQEAVGNRSNILKTLNSQKVTQNVFLTHVVNAQDKKILLYYMFETITQPRDQTNNLLFTTNITYSLSITTSKPYRHHKTRGVKRLLWLGRGRCSAGQPLPKPHEGGGKMRSYQNSSKGRSFSIAFGQWMAFCKSSRTSLGSVWIWMATEWRSSERILFGK